MQFSAIHGTLAQTNLQLVNQLSGDGYSVEELQLICDAYALAVRLYSGYFMASGRSQIDHVVGTASILGVINAPPAVVAAGLIHNAYDNGDFGTCRYGMTAAKRNEIIRAVGKNVETFVEKFHILRQTMRPIPSLLAEMDIDDQVGRYTVLIEVAERLEHYLNDAGLPGSTKYLRRNLPIMIDAVQKLGFPALADAIQEASDLPDAHNSAFSELAKRSGGNRSGWMAPASYRKRLSIRFHQAAIHGYHRLGRQSIIRRLRRLLGS